MSGVGDLMVEGTYDHDLYSTPKTSSTAGDHIPPRVAHHLLERRFKVGTPRAHPLPGVDGGPLEIPLGHDIK